MFCLGEFVVNLQFTLAKFYLRYCIAKSMLFLIILDRIIYKHIVKSDLSIIVDPNQAEIRYPVDPLVQPQPPSA